MKFRFIVSLASLLPWTSWPFSWLCSRFIERAQKAGFTGLQAVPFRGIWRATSWSLPVFYKEHAWNPVWVVFQVLPVLKNLRFMWGASGLPAGPKDWVLFPTPWACHATERRLPGQTIDHDFKPGATLVEICPELGTPEQIADLCRRLGVWLVFDTQHFLRPKTHLGEPSVLANETNWREALRVLAPYIRVIHVKSTTGMDAEMLRYFLSIAEPRLYDVVAEFMPSKQSIMRQLEYLRNFLAELRQLCGVAA